MKAMSQSRASQLSDKAALVLFSGGQDSATCVAWAVSRFERVETLGFTYGQRHSVELECRPKFLAGLKDIMPAARTRLGDDHMLDLSLLGAIGGTAMTEESAITAGSGGLPTTFVPGRNLLFFVAASALAWRRGIRHLVGGMCETDYSGYPDCRNETLQALGRAINLGTDEDFVIDTPLMQVDKAGTFALARALGGEALLHLVIADTHSCYRGDRMHRHVWGYGCNDCPACDLRRKGYEKFSERA